MSHTPLAGGWWPICRPVPRAAVPAPPKPKKKPTPKPKAAVPRAKKRTGGPAVPTAAEARAEREARAAGYSALVRGALIRALDEQLVGGDLGVALCQGDEPTGPAGRLLDDLRDAATRPAGWRLLRSYMLTEVYQVMMLALFPEEFGDPGDPPGICPPSGPRRVGAERLRAFAGVVLRRWPGRETRAVALAGRGNGRGPGVIRGPAGQASPITPATG